MINRRGEIVLPPVQWIQHNLDDIADLATEFAEIENEIGSQWILGFQLADSYLLGHLYRQLEQEPDMETQHQFAVGTVAAHYILQEVTTFSIPVIPKEVISRALHYLAAPTPWFGKNEGLDVALAHSAHFILDPEGFASTQRLLSVDNWNLTELETVIA